MGIGALRPRRGELQATLKRVMERYGISLTGIPLRGHPIPIYLRREPVATRRTLLVGDAAGLVDPFSGEGIRFAVKSGRLAADAILSGMVERYPEWAYREIGSNHKLGAGLALLFYHFPDLCFALGVRNPLATPAFVDLLGDKIRYPQVILRLFGSLPLFVAAEVLATLTRHLPGSERQRKVRADASQRSRD